MMFGLMMSNVWVYRTAAYWLKLVFATVLPSLVSLNTRPSRGTTVFQRKPGSIAG